MRHLVLLLVTTISGLDTYSLNSSSLDRFECVLIYHLTFKVEVRGINRETQEWSPLYLPWTLNRGVSGPSGAGKYRVYLLSTSEGLGIKVVDVTFKTDSTSCTILELFISVNGLL